MNEFTVIRYTFNPYFSGYFQEGKFYDSKDRVLKEKHYNGRNCIQSENKRYGIKTLRKFAVKSEVTIEIMPF